MRFTDDNLGRLKINPGVLYPGQKKPIVLIDRDVLQALLARLEAAEKVCEIMIEFHPFRKDCPTWIAMEAWRKVAGK